MFLNPNNKSVFTFPLLMISTFKCYTVFQLANIKRHMWHIINFTDADLTVSALYPQGKYSATTQVAVSMEGEWYSEKLRPFLCPFKTFKYLVL